MQKHISVALWKILSYSPPPKRKKNLRTNLTIVLPSWDVFDSKKNIFQENKEVAYIFFFSICIKNSCLKLFIYNSDKFIIFLLVLRLMFRKQSFYVYEITNPIYEILVIYNCCYNLDKCYKR